MGNGITLVTAAMMVWLSGCAGMAAQTESAATAGGVPSDTLGRNAIPIGFGSLHQDDLSFHLDAGGFLVRALPLEESLIRLLTPDSYRAMHELRTSNRAAIAAAERRYGNRRLSVWLVSFYGVSPDVQFTPLDLMVTSNAQDFHPYDLIPLTTGFSEQRIRQRETQNALYLFDGDIQLDQPVTVSYEGIQDNSWDQTLQHIERERAMVRARAGQTQ
jgi:hypothetical protein